jgi:hypothetical protein
VRSSPETSLLDVIQRRSCPMLAAFAALRSCCEGRPTLRHSIARCSRCRRPRRERGCPRRHRAPCALSARELTTSAQRGAALQLQKRRQLVGARRHLAQGHRRQAEQGPRRGVPTAAASRSAQRGVSSSGQKFVSPSPALPSRQDLAARTTGGAEHEHGCFQHASRSRREWSGGGEREKQTLWPSMLMTARWSFCGCWCR